MKKTIIVFLSAVVSVMLVKVASAQTETFTANTTIPQNTTWDGTVIIDGARVTIAQDATLTIKPGTIISSKNGALIYVVGKLKALGKKDEKIRFTAEYNEKPAFSLTYYIDSTGTSEIDMDHFILEKGGGNEDTASLPALTIRGKASLSRGIIRRNYISAVRVWGTDVKVEDCEIYENENVALENKSTSKTLKAENNWWGSEDGPTVTTIPNSPRSIIKGSLDFDPWQKKGPIPIVILPGFGGSFSFKLLSDKAKNDWWLTTLGTSAYRYFAKALILSNYYHDKDFFWGFYDWRMACENSAKKYLEETIDKAKEKSGHSQVHIVAHSMGGLVARSYIEGDSFRDDIDQLVTAGTPHLGSSEAYPIWEGGQLLDNKKPIYLYLWYLEALNWDWNKVQFVRKNFPSVGEMMPTYDYLESSFDGNPIQYKNQKEHNVFLENLAEPENMDKLKRKVATNLVVGKGEKTLEKIQVSPYEGGDGKWIDGIPNPIEPPKDTENGDGTVILESARAKNALTKNIFVIDSSHSKLLESGTKPILEQLKVKAKFPLLFKLMSQFLLTAKGPVEINIENGHGKIVSVSKQEIEDSQYHEEKIDGQKLVFSDFPADFESEEEKHIKITFTGLEKGDFRAAFWNFSNNDSYAKQEIDNPVTKGMQVGYEINIGENEITFSTVTPLKSLMVLINRLYEEKKITQWSTRSQLINGLAEAYQEFSNDKIDSAKISIHKTKNDFTSSQENVFADTSTKNKISESLEHLAKNPE